MTQEQIGYLKFEDLVVFYDELTKKRQLLQNRNYNTTSIEIEIAYVQRELQQRELSAQLHREYLKTLPVDEDFVADDWSGEDQ